MKACDATEPEFVASQLLNAIRIFYWRWLGSFAAVYCKHLRRVTCVLMTAVHSGRLSSVVTYIDGKLSICVNVWTTFEN